MGGIHLAHSPYHGAAVMSPIALSDTQLDIIMAAAKPLSPSDRDVFLRRVAAALASEPLLGDGLVARTCRQVFSEHWVAPELDPRVGVGKHGR